MFLLIAVTKNELDQWSIKKLPVLQLEAYSVAAWSNRLGLYLASKQNQVWLASHSIPIKLATALEVNVMHKSIREMEGLLKKWSKLFNIKWHHVQKLELSHTLQSKKSEQRVTEALALWYTSIERAIEGKLLHLYEFQKSLAFHNVAISLEQVTDYIFIWCWFELLGVYGGIKKRSGIMMLTSIFLGQYECRRCMNNAIHSEQANCYSCGPHCLYCSECVQLGKVRSCSLLLYKTEEYQLSKTKLDECTIPASLEKMISPYKLSDAQADAVKEILKAVFEHYANHQHIKDRQFKLISRLSLNKSGGTLNYLIWAVTGAGKTEMIYPLIHYFLLMGKRVLIAIPRRDVVQELQPRISKAFPEQKVISLFGGSKHIWEFGDIYIATTHQLVRYHTYFDLVILDEMDAFPYYSNRMLVQTLKRVQKKDACFIQLTATVPRKEKLQLYLRKQHYVKVPVRFHRYPLPVPKFLKIPPLLSILQTKQLPHTLISVVAQSAKREAVLFIFLQRKAYLAPLSDLLQKSFPHLNITYTSAEDNNRKYKVQQFRNRQINVLVTTSILERGVTIKKSDICILDVHQRAFNRTAIIQMAGRAGRSIEDPNGLVYLLGVEKTSEVKGAINEIVAMNKLAEKRGYLRSECHI